VFRRLDARKAVEKPLRTGSRVQLVCSAGDAA
jgi:hypothetical protein